MEYYKNSRKFVYSPSIAPMSHQGVIDAAHVAYVTRGENERKAKRARCKSTRSKPAGVSHVVAREPVQSLACHGSLNYQLHSACAAARFAFLAPHYIQKRSLVASGFPGRICTLLAVIPQPSYLYRSFSVSHFSPVTISRKPESLFNPLATNSETGLGDYHTNSSRSTRFGCRQTYARVRVCLWNLRI